MLQKKRKKSVLYLAACVWNAWNEVKVTKLLVEGVLMSLKPAFDISQNVPPQPFDKTLCLFCQTVVEVSKNKQGRPKKDSSDDFQNFIDICSEHVKYETGKYTELNIEIGGWAVEIRRVLFSR